MFNKGDNVQINYHRDPTINGLKGKVIHVDDDDFYFTNVKILIPTGRVIKLSSTYLIEEKQSNEDICWEDINKLLSLNEFILSYKKKFEYGEHKIVILVAKGYYDLEKLCTDISIEDKLIKMMSKHKAFFKVKIYQKRE